MRTPAVPCLSYYACNKQKGLAQLELTRKEARALAVIASLLDRKPYTRKPTASDVMDVVNHLCMVQLDTISVVSRAHETTIWSRLGPYDPDHWPSLYQKGLVTELMTHAAAITPVQYIPLVKPMLDVYRDRSRDRLEEEGVRQVVSDVLARISAEGPLGSRHFDAPEIVEKGEQWSSWYGAKPEREVLARLWYSGDLLISLRDRAFSRWFDLPERVAPEHWFLDPPDEHLRQCELVRHAMRALGVGTATWVTDYWRTGNMAYVPNRDVRRILHELTDLGELVVVTVPGVSQPAYLDASLLVTLDSLRNGKGWPTRTTFLSPFDNLIWNRGRMRDLFDMEYTLEIYVPAARRQYGYYVMPILHRGQLIGRMDPGLDRKTGTLTIKSLHLEPGIRWHAAMARSIAKALDEYAAFLEATDWGILQSDPAEFGALVQRS